MRRFVTFGLLAALVVFLHCAATCVAAPLERPAAENVPPCHKSKPVEESAANCHHAKIDSDQQQRTVTLDASPWELALSEPESRATRFAWTAATPAPEAGPSARVPSLSLRI